MRPRVVADLQIGQRHLLYTRPPKSMRRAILSFMLGIFCTALFLNAISVYVFHDVDHDKIGHWNEAFADLSVETILFSLVIGGSVGLLALLGRPIFHLSGHSPRAKLALALGIAVTVLQYPFEFLGRKFAPNHADFFLFFYLVAAALLCTAVLLRDTFNQLKRQKALNLHP